MSKEIEELNKQIEKEKELLERKKVLSEKELDLKEKRVEVAFTNLVKAKEEAENSKTVSFGAMTDEETDRLLEANAAYLEAAKHPIPFICSEFDSIVPFFRKNLILLMSPTGGGKSTCVCNICYTAMVRKDPLKDQPYRVLIITNEEASEDLLNRLCCFSHGWRYTNHDQFTDEQREEFTKFIKYFAKNGNVRVVSDTIERNGVTTSGWSTTVEGIVQVFDNMIRDKDFYDIVLIDYFQNITRSRERPELNEYEVQRVLANEFDRIKNIYPGVIVLMAQCDPLHDESDTKPYTLRLKGSKLITTKSTFICEIAPEYNLLRSRWKIHKSRFTDSIGKEIITGFDKGRYVNYSIHFQKKVAELVEKNLEREKEEQLGLGNNTDKDERDEK